MVFPLYLTLIRIIAPLLILKFPLIGILLAIFIDGSDWNLIDFKSQEHYDLYQYWDKGLDLYFLSLAAVTTLAWRNLTARKIALSLFFYRVVGDSIFFLTGHRYFLFLFPNFFESYFVFYLLYSHFNKKFKLTFTFKNCLLLITSLAIPKIIHEYFVHFLLKQPWEIYKFTANQSYNEIVWYSLLYFLPFTLGLLLIRPTKRGSQSTKLR